MRRFLFGLFVIAGVLGAPAVAGAQSISSTVTLHGYVPPMRFAYVNQDGFITKIGGNTSDNITLRVATLDNKELPLTESVSQQYDYFMRQHGWKLEAGVIYEVNPVQINTQVNTQQIEINTQTQTSANNRELQVGFTPGFGQNG